MNIDRIAEREAFAANYVEMGGRMQFLEWDGCEDGAGTYKPDWAAIAEAGISSFDFDEEIQEHAEHVTGCLMAWLQCAETKAIPEGYVLMPIEPSEKALKFLGGSKQEATMIYKALVNLREKPAISTEKHGNIQ